MAGPFAGAALLAALGGVRGILTTGAVAALPSALSSIFDNNESLAGKTGEVLGSGLGAVPGALGGAALGGLAGGRQYGRYLRGPGAIVGGLAGAGLGSSALGAGARQVAGENVDPLMKAARQQMQIERERLPLLAQQTSLASQLEVDRAEQMMELERRRNQQAAAMQMAYQGQQNSAALQQQLIASILGGGGVV